MKTGALTWNLSGDKRTLQLEPVRIAVFSEVLTGEIKNEAIKQALVKTLNHACAEAGIWPQSRIAELEKQLAELNAQNYRLRFKIRTGEYPSDEAEVTK